MITKKELYGAVKQYNDRYCKKTKNRLTVSEAYGGCAVRLTGKKRGNGYVKGSLRSSEINIGLSRYDTPTNAFTNLVRAESRGDLKRILSFYEAKKK